jgi:hypothetical protein
MYLPDYPWAIIKEFLLKKKHPTSKLIKKYADRYHRPQIFMSRYVKLRNGMYVRVEKPVLQIEQSLNMSFQSFVYVKSVR